MASPPGVVGNLWRNGKLTMNRLGWAGALLALATALAGPVPVAAQDGVGFRFAFGRSAFGGDMAGVMDPAADAEFSILHPVGPLRLGAGANWASFRETGADASWSQVKFHTLVGYRIQTATRLRLYAEGRYTFRRLRPEDDRFFGGEEKLLREYVASGSGYEGVVGAEIVLHPRVAVDVSGAYGSFGVRPDLSAEGLGAVDSGIGTRIHLGLAWFPVNKR